MSLDCVSVEFHISIFQSEHVCAFCGHIGYRSQGVCTIDAVLHFHSFHEFELASFTSEVDSGSQL